MSDQGWQAPTGGPPPPPPPPPAWGNPPYPPPPGYGPPPPPYGGWAGQPSPYYYAQAPQNDGMAVASLVLGILSIVGVVFCFTGLVLGPIAIVLGSMSRKRINESRGQLTGAGMASAGLITGIIGTAIGVLILALFIVGASSAHFNNY